MTYFKVFVPLEMCSIQIKYIIFIHLLIKAPSVIILVIFPFIYLFLCEWYVFSFIKHGEDTLHVAMVFQSY